MGFVVPSTWNLVWVRSHTRFQHKQVDPIAVDLMYVKEVEASKDVEESGNMEYRAHLRSDWVAGNFYTISKLVSVSFFFALLVKCLRYHFIAQVVVSQSDWIKRHVELPSRCGCVEMESSWFQKISWSNNCAVHSHQQQLVFVKRETRCLCWVIVFVESAHWISNWSWCGNWVAWTWQRVPLTTDIRAEPRDTCLANLWMCGHRQVLKFKVWLFGCRWRFCEVLRVWSLPFVGSEWAEAIQHAMTSSSLERTIIKTITWGFSEWWYFIFIITEWCL